MLTAGIDVGSISAKAVLMADGRILATKVILTGYNASKAGETVLDSVLTSSGITRGDISKIVATGYGRNAVAIADKAVTEITCHASGAHLLNPDVRFVIDIGGQDSKAIAIDADGRVIDFAMNDKCAAGTGRFLEVMARALEVDLDAFGTLSLNADQPAVISSLCTVFAESEVISLISRGASRENIIAGIHASIGARVMAMANRVGLQEPIMMTGGVAKNAGVVKALEDKCGRPIIVSPHAQVNGAIGAALVAAAMR